MGGQRRQRVAELLDVGLRIRRVVLGQANERQILFLPEIGVIYANVVDGRDFKPGNVIALAQHR